MASQYAPVYNGPSAPPSSSATSFDHFEKSSFIEQAHTPMETLDEEPDEDMDALIDELESNNGDAEEEYPGSSLDDPCSPLPLSDKLFQTDRCNGLVDSEVLSRRKKFGHNQMKEQKENHYLKILSFFIGPIQFVMEVCLVPCQYQHSATISFFFFFFNDCQYAYFTYRLLHSLPLASGTGLISGLSAVS